VLIQFKSYNGNGWTAMIALPPMLTWLVVIDIVELISCMYVYILVVLYVTGAGTNMVKKLDVRHSKVCIAYNQAK